MGRDYDPEREAEAAIKLGRRDWRAGEATLDQSGDGMAGARPHAVAPPLASGGGTEETA